MNKCFKSALIYLLFIEQNILAIYHSEFKFLCDGYVIDALMFRFKSLNINDFLCDAYVIGGPFFI